MLYSQWHRFTQRELCKINDTALIKLSSLYKSISIVQEGVGLRAEAPSAQALSPACYTC